MAQPITPTELADTVAPTLDDALVAFDVDGVLAPIVEHADDAALTPGLLDSLAGLGRRVPVAIVSWRAVESLERLFRFPEHLHVIGSHGLEERGATPMALDEVERQRLAQLELLGRKAVDAAGDGAWLEQKPASVVLHTRSADRSIADPATDALTDLASMVEGAQVKPGHEIVELLARPASKGIALLALATRLERSPIVFLGDDVTDEEAFRLMSDVDVPVRVGPGETAARHRLADTAAVAEFVRVLSAR